MSAFFVFPRTPHLAWLGEGALRDDKVLSPADASALLDGQILVEEKVDGANVGVAIDESGMVRAWNRGTSLTREHRQPEFKLLFGWIAEHRRALLDRLSPALSLFGEWCYAVHGTRYTRLPDWFLGFDVYDHREQRFWSTARRDDLLNRLGLHLVPRLAKGRFSLSSIRDLIGSSRLGEGPAEGLYVRRDEGDWLAARAKLVRPEFVQSIDEHWTQRPLEKNTLVRGYSGSKAPTS